MRTYVVGDSLWGYADFRFHLAQKVREIRYALSPTTLSKNRRKLDGPISLVNTRSYLRGLYILRDGVIHFRQSCKLTNNIGSWSVLALLAAPFRRPYFSACLAYPGVLLYLELPMLAAFSTEVHSLSDPIECCCPLPIIIARGEGSEGLPADRVKAAQLTLLTSSGWVPSTSVTGDRT